MRIGTRTVPNGLITVAKVCLVALVAWFIHRTAWQAWSDLRERHWNPASLRPGWLALAVALGGLGFLPPAIFWHRLLRNLGQPVRLGETVRAYYLAQLGKYVPGKGMVLVLRAGFLRAGGTTATASTVAVFYETFTTLAAGAFWAIVILGVRFPEHAWLMLSAALGLAAVGLPTVPPVFRRLVRLTGAGKLDPEAVERLVHLRFSTIAPAWVGLGIAWLLQGGCLWATLAAAGFASRQAFSWADQVAVCTAANALAVVAGFLSFVPGGLGVREGALLVLLEPWFGRDAALVAAVASRLVGLLAEFSISSVVWFIRPRSPRGRRW